MKFSFFLSLIFIVLLLGCASSTQKNQKQNPFQIPEMSEAGEVAAQPAPSQPQVSQTVSTKLPTQYTASANPEQNRSLREIEKALRNIPPQNLSSDSLSLGEIFITTRRRSSAVKGVLATDGDFDHLKALTALDLPPLVVTRSVVGRKHVWAMVSFDDEAQMLTLANPLQKSQIKQSYSAFIKSWGEADTRHSFLLISAQALTSNSVKFELGKYLTEDRVAKLSLTE